MKFELYLGDCQTAPIDNGVRCGMEHHCGINIGEQTGIHHDYLSAATFLPRRAEEQQSPRQFGFYCSHCQCRAQSGGSDQVVTTGMTELGEGIIFTDDRHGGAVAYCGIFGPDRGGEASYPEVDVKPTFLQFSGKELGRVVFLKLEFGMVVDIATHPD